MIIIQRIYYVALYSCVALWASNSCVALRENEKNLLVVKIPVNSFGCGKQNNNGNTLNSHAKLSLSLNSPVALIFTPIANLLLNVWIVSTTGQFTCNIKVHLTPKYFFHSNKSLHLFETHCAFLPLFNPNLDLLQAVKVTKSGHYLLHDQASKGYGSTPVWTSQTDLHACLQRLNMMQSSLWRPPRNRPIPLACSVVQQILARFRNFYSM